MVEERRVKRLVEWHVFYFELNRIERRVIRTLKEQEISPALACYFLYFSYYFSRSSAFKNTFNNIFFIIIFFYAFRSIRHRMICYKYKFKFCIFIYRIFVKIYIIGYSKSIFCIFIKNTIFIYTNNGVISLVIFLL